MAPKKKSVTVKLTSPQAKKHVVRYDCEDENGAMSSAYIRNEDVKALGDPDTIKVTIEAA